MEHSSNSCLWPHRQDASPRLSVRSSYTPLLPDPSSSTAHGSPYQGATPQTRQLQLRNARFNGPSSPARRLSPLLGLNVGHTDSISRPKAQDNSPFSTEKRSLYGEKIPPNPVNILQEIHNSAKKKKISPPPGFGMIFEDQRPMDENSSLLDDEEISWYDERSTECSPSITRGGSFKMGLREGSINKKSQPPLNSLFAKQTTRRSMAYSSLHSDNVEQSRYIEHLESQLVSAQAKIDTLTSPKTNKMRSVKLRSLAAENRNLRTENSGWARKAEEMVQQERLRYVNSEVEMNSRLLALEEDVEVKDARIAEFEWELESMRTQLKDAEGLEEANANLEKKIDMLSNMLVGSPDNFESHPAATSPVRCSARFSPSKRTSRPISVLSRVASSPTRTRLSLASVSETAFWDSRSRSASIVGASEALSPLETQDARVQSPTLNGGMVSPDSSKQLSYFDSYDGHRDWTSDGTRTGPSSPRPTSFASTSSMGAPSWGVPMLPDGESRFSNRQRRMRKFPSGSSTLKPLILPVATNANVQSLPASASVYPSIETVANRDVSNSFSTDQTASLLSRLVDSSQNSAPNALSQPQSAKSAREQTLNALEGRHRDVRGDGKETDEETCIASSSSSGTRSAFSTSYCGHRSRPKSLEEELKEAEVEQAHLNALGITAPDDLGDGLTAEGLGLSNRQHHVHLSQGNLMPQAYSESNQSNVNTPPTPKASNSASPNPISDHPRSLFARMTNLVTQVKQDPFILARRILTNAWILGSASMGGMGWWLIGPLHHHQRYHALEDSSNADPHHSADGPARTRPRDRSNWQHFSTEIRDGHVIDTRPARDYEGRWVTSSKSRLNDERDDKKAGSPLLSGAMRGEPHLFPCNECVEPSSRRTLRMWFQFSLTVVLAVALAVRYGPRVLLADLSNGGRMAICPCVASNRIDEQTGRRRQHTRIVSQNNEHVTTMFGAAVADKGKVSSRLLDSRDGAESGYGSIAFAEPLRPTDFEAG